MVTEGQCPVQGLYIHGISKSMIVASPACNYYDGSNNFSGSSSGCADDTSIVGEILYFILVSFGEFVLVLALSRAGMDQAYSRLSPLEVIAPTASWIRCCMQVYAGVGAVS